MALTVLSPYTQVWLLVVVVLVAVAVVVLEAISKSGRIQILVR